MTFICRQKINLILHVFLEILQRYCELVVLGTLGIPDYAYPKWYHQLVENLDVYLSATNILHHSLLSWDITFWRILQFDWLTVFSPITREPEFCQIKDWWWNINNNINFHFELFTRKTINKIFQKIEKPYFGAILDPFCKDLGKNEFSWKKRLCQFLNILIIYHHTKNQKKIMCHSWGKCRTDGRTDRQTDKGDRQTTGQGSN